MSGLSHYIVDAVVLERRSPTELAHEHGISRRWIHKLVKRFKEGGYASLEPRSRRPHCCAHQTSSDIQAKSFGCDRSSSTPVTTLGLKPSPTT
jgi:transposase